MYQVSITAAGTEYFFAVDNQEGVRTLVNESYRVTSVKIWEDSKELTTAQINNLVFGELSGV
jgi:DNA-binding protein